MTCCCGISAVKKPVFCWTWANSSCGCGAPLCFTCRPGALPETIRFPLCVLSIKQRSQTQDEEKLSEEEGHNRQSLSRCLISNHRAHSLHFPLYYSLPLSLCVCVCATDALIVQSVQLELDSLAGSTSSHQSVFKGHTQVAGIMKALYK